MTSATHIALLELLGWTSAKLPDGYGWSCTVCRNPAGRIVQAIPTLDDALLRTAREQLLTTEELRGRFLSLLAVELKMARAEIPWSCQWTLTPKQLFKILSASPIDQATALVGMAEAFKKI